MATRPPSEELALERSLLIGVAAFRWAAWVWMAVVLAIDGRAGALAHPWGAVGIAAATLAFTGVATVLVRVDPGRLLRTSTVGLEVALASGVVLVDPLVYAGAHPQILGSSWALAGILSAGVALAGRGGLLAGTAVGAARMAGLALWEPGAWDSDRWLSATSSVVLYALAGGIAGFAAIRLREAEREISAARAREEIARRLHDGVLQTLAVVQRRSADEELAALAREQEHELRSFLFGVPTTEQASLEASLRDAVARAERLHRLRVDLVLAPDLPALSPPSIDALVGAMGEALTNAAKHGGAARATVYVEPEADGTIFCSVKDDGAGFDPARTEEGVGLSRSVRARIEEIGGMVEVDGNPGRGAEVRLRLP